MRSTSATTASLPTVQPAWLGNRGNSSKSAACAPNTASTAARCSTGQWYGHAMCRPSSTPEPPQTQPQVRLHPMPQGSVFETGNSSVIVRACASTLPWRRRA